MAAPSDAYRRRGPRRRGKTYRRRRSSSSSSSLGGAISTVELVAGSGQDAEIGTVIAPAPVHAIVLAAASGRVVARWLLEGSVVAVAASEIFYLYEI